MSKKKKTRNSAERSRKDYYDYEETNTNKTQVGQKTAKPRPEKYELQPEEDFDRRAYAKESAKQSSKRRNQQAEEKASRNVSGVILVILQALVSIVFGVLLGILNILNTSYMAVIIIVLALLFLFTLITQFYRNGRPVGKVFAVLISVVLIIGSLYLWKTYSAVAKVSSGSQITTRETKMSFIVMKDSPLTGQEDLSGKQIGIMKTQDRPMTDQALDSLKGKLAQDPVTMEFTSQENLIDALYNGNVDCILMNEALRSIVIENFKPNFDVETRLLETFTIEEKVENSQKNISVDEDPFTVYLSGNDQWGDVTLDSGRSDVNIIATVNPKTKTILLTTTPRDYYVPLYFSDTEGGGDEYLDKLTHSGVYGMNCSMSTLEKLYGIDLDYYVRINFSGFQNIIDALGGIDIDSPYAFTTSDGSHTYVKGMNHLDGYGALLFCRERYAFSNGDLQRGQNQMLMIKAMVKKIMSPAILPNFMNLMDQMSSCFITDIPMSSITDLVKYQLTTNTDWKIITDSVSGYGASRISYAMGSYVSVIVPDYNDVDQAKQLIQKCLKGEEITQPKENSNIEVYPSNGSSNNGSTDNSQTPQYEYNNPGNSYTEPSKEESSQEESITPIVDPESSLDPGNGSGGEETSTNGEGESGSETDPNASDSGDPNSSESSESSTPENPESSSDNTPDSSSESPDGEEGSDGQTGDVTTDTVTGG